MTRFWKIALCAIGFLILLVLFLRWIGMGPSGTHDQVMLKSVNVEAHVLLEGRTTKTETDSKTGIETGIAIPEKEWPATIASLHPRFVTVFSDGVDIRIVSEFGDHFGYFVPLNGRRSAGPVNCISPLGQGVYWYNPC